MHALARYGLVAVIAMFPLLSHAACPDQEAAAAYVADFQAKRVSKGFGNDLSQEDAQCAKGKVIQELAKTLGPAVGYKAAFTNPALQKRFGVTGITWAAMFDGMRVESGARVPARFGARPLYEADFLAVVKDAGLADARTPLEALQHLSAVVPFMELADLMLEGNPTGTALIATNIAFRGTASGTPVAVEPTQAFLDSLANMDVVMTEDRSGKELGRTKGSVIMDNPINAAMWIAQQLKKEGITLKPGDLLSLGGYFPPTPTQPGTSITVRYLGLKGDPSVTVHFD